MQLTFTLVESVRWILLILLAGLYLGQLMFFPPAAGRPEPFLEMRRIIRRRLWPLKALLIAGVSLLRAPGLSWLGRQEYWLGGCLLLAVLLEAAAELSLRQMRELLGLLGSMENMEHDNVNRRKYDRLRHWYQAWMALAILSLLSGVLLLPAALLAQQASVN